MLYLWMKSKRFSILPTDRRGYYLALKDTGCRPIEIIGLRKKDFTLINGKYKALIPAHLTKKKITRTVAFSRESSPYITKFLSRCNDEYDNPFGSNSDPEIARETEDRVFRYYCDKLGKDDGQFNARYESTGYHKINLYCLRGYFFTKVLRAVGDDTAHAMIGHGHISSNTREEQMRKNWNYGLR